MRDWERLGEQQRLLASLQARAAAGQLDRRGFLRLAAAAGVGSASAVALADQAVAAPVVQGRGGRGVAGSYDYIVGGAGSAGCAVAARLSENPACRVLLIESPRLLMLSGVGNTDELRRHGISAVTNLPGVGENLQDHPFIVAFVAETKAPMAPGSRAGSHLFFRSTQDAYSPDTQALLATAAVELRISSPTRVSRFVSPSSGRRAVVASRSRPPTRMCHCSSIRTIFLPQAT
jgi:GMC oxidoreductase